MPYPKPTVSIEGYSGISKPIVLIDKIGFISQDELTISHNQIVVFVGPNNVGKSVALKEIYEFVSYKIRNPKIVQAISLVKVGTAGDVKVYLDKNYKRSPSSPDYIVTDTGRAVDMNSINGFWSNPEVFIGTLAGAFTLFLSTADRLGITTTANSLSVLSDSPSHPSHHLLLKEEFEKQFSTYFKRAFNLDLIVNRGAGNKVPLHVGEAPEKRENEDRVSRSYLERLSQLPILELQGDGMRSFVGVMLSAFVAEQTMIFIDEPEAFLHPPQAFILGQMLANDLPSDKQIFLSTHSEDLLKGLVDKDSDRVKIIRIERNGNKNTFNELDSEAIRALWSDPLLKYSNILSGLFHSKVIVCESDGDCRFFSAILDAVIENENLNKPDILFVHCGGKHRITTVINALVKVGVKVLAVTDFDVLNDKSPLKEIYEGLGGDWPEIEANWKGIKQVIDAKKPELDSSAVKSKIEKILSTITHDTFPSAKAEEIRKVLKKASPWSEAKNMGKTYIPSGEPNQMLTRLMNQCKSKGLNILDVGELECFDKSIGGHGPAWVNQVLRKDLRNDTDLENARRFVKQLLEQ